MYPTMTTKKPYQRKAHYRTLRNGRRLYVPPKIIQPKPPEPPGKYKDTK